MRTGRGGLGDCGEVGRGGWVAEGGSRAARCDEYGIIWVRARGGGQEEGGREDRVSTGGDVAMQKGGWRTLAAWSVTFGAAKDSASAS